MQLSTNITKKDERKTFFDLMKKQNKVHETDLYLNCLSEEKNFVAKGECIEFRSHDLGPDDRSIRLTKLQQQVAKEAQEYKKQLSEMDTKQKDLQKEKKEKESQLKEKKQEISDISKKKARKNKKIATVYSQLREQINNLETSLAEIEIELNYLPERRGTIQKAYDRRQEIIDAAVEREKAIIEIDQDMIAALDEQKSKFQDMIKKLRKEETELREKKEVEDKESKLMKIEAMISTLQSNILKINSDIFRLKSRTSGTVKERYYLMQSWKKEDDLICFSRRFNSKEGNIESEMSHVPRVNVDSKASNRPMWIMIVVLGILDSILLASDLLGFYIDLLTWHTLYWVVILAMFFGANMIVQKVDKVFHASYYTLYSHDIDIIYFDENEDRRVLRVQCYSLELLVSDKTSVNDLFTSTEADIIRNIDQRNQDLTMKFEKLLSQLELTELSLREEIQQLQLQNQELASRYERAYYNAKADVARDQGLEIKDLKDNEWIPVVQTTVTMLGLIGIVAVIGFAIPDQIGANFLNISVSSGKAFFFGLIIGIVATIFIVRWISSGQINTRNFSLGR